MEWITQRSLRTTLLTVFLILGLLPLVIGGLLAYQSAEGSLTDGARQRLSDVSYNAVDKLDRNLFERYGDVQAYAQSDAARSMEAERITAWMNKMMATYTPIYKLMIVADPSGKIIAVNTVDLDNKTLMASRSLVGRSVAGETWFREAINGNIKEGTSLVTDLHADDLLAAVYGTTNQADLAMSFTAPIRDDSGKIIGVWSNRFNWAVATALIAEVEGRARTAGMTTTRLALVNQARTILIAPAVDQTLKASLAGRASLQGLTRQRDGRGDGSGLASNQPAFEAASASPGYSTYAGLNWAVVATQDVAEALANVGQLRLMMIAVGLVAALLIAGTAWTIANFIAQRVGQVASAARQVAEIDLPQLVSVIKAIGENDFNRVAEMKTQRLHVTGSDEVGVMAKNFNQMVDQLHEVETATRVMSVSIETILNRRQVRRA